MDKSVANSTLEYVPSIRATEQATLMLRRTTLTSHASNRGEKKKKSPTEQIGRDSGIVGNTRYFAFNIIPLGSYVSETHCFRICRLLNKIILQNILILGAA